MNSHINSINVTLEFTQIFWGKEDDRKFGKEMNPIKSKTIANIGDSSGPTHAESTNISINHVKIVDLQANAPNITIIGLIIAKQCPRSIPSKRGRLFEKYNTQHFNKTFYLYNKPIL